MKARELLLEVALELLVPHGQRAEDLADRDGGADLARRRRALEQLAAAAELERRRDLLAGLARGDGQRAERRQRAQRLAAEAEGLHRLQVGERRQLGGVVAQRERGVVGGGDARAVVGHLDLVHPVLLQPHLHPRRPRVDGVLHQLLDLVARDTSQRGVGVGWGAGSPRWRGPAPPGRCRCGARSSTGSRGSRTCSVPVLAPRAAALSDHPIASRAGLRLRLLCFTRAVTLSTYVPSGRSLNSS